MTETGQTSNTTIFLRANTESGNLAQTHFQHLAAARPSPAGQLAPTTAPKSPSLASLSPRHRYVPMYRELYRGRQQPFVHISVPPSPFSTECRDNSTHGGQRQPCRRARVSGEQVGRLASGADPMRLNQVEPGHLRAEVTSLLGAATVPCSAARELPQARECLSLRRHLCLGLLPPTKQHEATTRQVKTRCILLVPGEGGASGLSGRPTASQSGAMTSFACLRLHPPAAPKPRDPELRSPFLSQPIIVPNSRAWEWRRAPSSPLPARPVLEDPPVHQQSPRHITCDRNSMARGDDRC